VLSLGNAFRALGDARITKSIMSQLEASILNSRGPITFAKELVTRTPFCYKVVAKRSFDVFDFAQPDPLEGYYQFRIICQLEDNFKGITHAVSLLGNCVYDANFDFAMPISKYNFDSIRASHDKGSIYKYKQIYHARWFSPNHPIDIPLDEGGKGKTIT
jgi:hypothetical protein